MERELERLLTRTTPPTPLPDIVALHRRGVRRRLAVRASAASVVVAVVAMGALAVQGLLAPGAIEFGTADAPEGEGAGAYEDAERAEREARESLRDALERERAAREAELPFGLEPEEIEAAAALLPDEGVEAEPDDVAAIRGTVQGEDPGLSTVRILCHRAEGSGYTSARHREDRLGPAITEADLVATCADWLGSGFEAAAGGTTLCEGTPSTAERQRTLDGHANDGWEISAPPGAAASPGPVPFPVVGPPGRDCADVELEEDSEVTFGELASLDVYNDRRRVEAAVKALERDCLSYPEALALGVATAARLDGDWRVQGLSPDTPPRARPCAGLDFHALWGTVIVMPESYWGRDLPKRTALEADDGRRVDTLGETLREALAAGDAAGVADAVEQVASLEGPKPPDTLREVRAVEGGEEFSAETVSALGSALNLGCLDEPSAVTLALTLQDLVSVHDDVDWFVGEVAVEDVTEADLDQPEPTCFRVNLTNTASFSTDRDPDPAIVVQPLWID